MPVDVGSAIAYLDLDTTKFQKGFKSALGDLKVFNDKTATTTTKLSTLSKSMSSVGSSLSTKVTLPLVGIGTTMVATAATFEKGMSQVQAISRASGTEMDSLKAKAIDMGAKTKFSASESADAFKFMAQAGWDTNDMLNGISGVMDLAAASGEDLATSSSIVTDALTAFGLQASDATRFADVLAMTANATNVDVSQMGNSFKYVAPVAGALGYKLEDVAVALGVMANNGIKGEQAGTSLRTLMTNLAKPTDDVAKAMKEYNISLSDTNGNILPFNTLLTNMREKFKGLTSEQKANLAATISGKEGMSGLLSIMTTTDESFNSLTNSINNSTGSAQEAAEIMQDNLSGSLEQLGGSAESLAISFGDIMKGSIRNLANFLADITDKINNMSESQKKMIVQIAEAIALGGPALLIGSKIVTMIKNMITFTGTFKAALLALKTGAALTSPQLTALVAVGTGVASLIALLAVKAANTKNKYTELAEETKKLSRESKEFNETVQQSIEQRKEDAETLSAQYGAYEKLANQLYSLNAKEKKSNEDKAEMISLVQQLNTAIPELNLSINEQTGYLTMQKDEVMNLISANKEYYKVKAAQEDLVEIAKEQYEAEKNQAELEKNHTKILKDIEEARTSGNGAVLRQAQGLYTLKKSLKENEEQMAASKTTMSNLDEQYETATGYITQHSNAVTDAKDAYQDYSQTVTVDTESITEELADLTEEYDKAFQESKESIEGQMGLFDEFSAKSETTGKQLLKNLETQVKGLKDWAKNLKELAKRGVDEGLLQELREMGPSAAGEIANLNTLSDKELAKYVKLWKEKSKLATDAAEEENKEMKEQIVETTKKLNESVTQETSDMAGNVKTNAKKASDNLKNEFKNSFPLVVGQFSDLSKDTKKNLDEIVTNAKQAGVDTITGLNTSIIQNKPLFMTTLNDLVTDAQKKSQLKPLFIPIGEQLPAGLRVGISNGKSLLIKGIEEMCETAAETARTKFQIHSPSKVFEVMGKYIDEGLAKGVLKNKKVTADAINEIGDLMENTGNAISTGLIKFNQKTNRLDYSDTYKTIMKKINLYYKDRDSRIKNMTKGTQSNIDSLNTEIEATRRATDLKIQLYEQELEAKKSLIDAATSAEVNALQSQIDEIDRQREQDSRNEATKQYNEELAAKELELTKATEEEKADIQKEIDELKYQRQKELLEQERSDKQDALRKQIEDIEAQSESKKETLEDEYNAKIYQLEQQYNAEVEYMNNLMVLLQKDYAERTELEETQTLIKQKQHELDTENMTKEQKQQTKNEIAELQAREKELKDSIKNNKKNLGDFTKDVDDIGSDYGDSLLKGFKSTEKEITTYLDSLYDKAKEITNMVNSIAGTDLTDAVVSSKVYVTDDSQTSKGTIYKDGESSSNSSSGGDTYIFNSPKALDPVESARQMKKSKQELALGF